LLKFLAPPEKILRWIEDKGRLRSRLPSAYVSIDRRGSGRFGTGADLPMSEAENGIFGSGQTGGLGV
jgi:hypothetical protein